MGLIVSGELDQRILAVTAATQRSIASLPERSEWQRGSRLDYRRSNGNDESVGSTMRSTMC